MSEEKRKELTRNVLLYLMVYDGDKTKEDIYNELYLLAENTKEIEYIKKVIDLELQCPTKYQVGKNGIVNKINPINAECCVLCHKSKLCYTNVGKDDVVVDIICEEINEKIGEGIKTEDSFVIPVSPNCPMLKLK